MRHILVGKIFNVKLRISRYRFTIKIKNVPLAFKIIGSDGVRVLDMTAAGLLVSAATSNMVQS
jgi:hypothetical protein